MKRYREDDLGNPTTNSEYGSPSFGVGTSTDPGPTPDAKLMADTAEAMSDGEDPGFSLGGANDPLAEYTSMDDISEGLDGEDDLYMDDDVNEPFSDDEISMNEDDIAYDSNGNLISDFSVQEDDDDDEEEISYDSVDDMPEFDEYDELDVAEEEVDGLGIIEPEVVETEITDPELGAVPDVELSMTEPIVQVEEDEPDVYATTNELEGTGPEPIIVEESFKLPEDKNIIVSKGDQIFVVGHAVNERTPKFTESAYKRAFRSLMEAKNIRGKISFKKSEGLKRCSLVGRSLLLEVAKDWRVPGTDYILEAHDIVQIVSMKPIVEKTCKKESDDDDNPEDIESTEEKKAKKEMFLAQRRYRAAKAKREASKKKYSEDDDDEDELSDEERKKTESFLRKHGIRF